MFETLTQCAIWLAEQHLKVGRKIVKMKTKKNMMTELKQQVKTTVKKETMTNE